MPATYYIRPSTVPGHVDVIRTADGARVDRFALIGGDSFVDAAKEYAEDSDWTIEPSKFIATAPRLEQ